MKELHYTNPQMVEALLKITPISGSVLDAGSGKNKVWFNSMHGEKYECEIEDGSDFYKWEKPVDWIVGNPPFHESWKFTEKAIEIARVGFAWLLNNQALNSHMTPRRLQTMQEHGFSLNHIHVVADKRWFGRYYYLIYSKKITQEFVSWELRTY